MLFSPEKINWLLSLKAGNKVLMHCLDRKWEDSHNTTENFLLNTYKGKLYPKQFYCSLFNPEVSLVREVTIKQVIHGSRCETGISLIIESCLNHKNIELDSYWFFYIE